MTKVDHPVRVMHLIGSLEPAGAERALVALLAHMPKSIASQVAVWGPPYDLKARLDELGVQVFRLKASCRWDPLALIRLRRLLRDQQIDILHTHLVRMHIAGHLALRGGPWVRQVCTHHSMAQSNQTLLRLAEKCTRRKRDVHVAVSKAAEDSYFHSSSLFEGLSGLPEPGHCTIHGGVDISGITAAVSEVDRRGLRRELKIHDAFTFVCVGRLHAVKGHVALLKAWARVVNACPRVRLLIVGDGPERASVEKHIRELGLSESVSLLGFRQDVYAVMAASDALVVASEYEGFGLVIAEAQALSLPIVTTAVGAAPELVSDKESGRIVVDASELAEAMEWMASAPKRAIACGEHGRQSVERAFAVSTCASNHARLYSEMQKQRMGNCDV